MMQMASLPPTHWSCGMTYALAPRQGLLLLLLAEQLPTPAPRPAMSHPGDGLSTINPANTAR